MKKLVHLVRRVFLGTTSVLIGTNIHSESVAGSSAPDTDSATDHITQLDQISKKPRLILKQRQRSDDWTIVAHRSHRSHSSHRSHYSHYSSRTVQPEDTSTTVKQPPYIKNWTTPKESPAPQKPKSELLELGSRALKKGMSGPDVLELKKLLVALGYKKIELNNTFDDFLTIAVKDFQSKNDIPADGKVGPLTVYYLKYK